MNYRIATLAAALAFFGVAPPALAADYHWAQGVGWYGMTTTVTGGRADITASCISDSNAANGYIDDEMWLFLTSDEYRWVEGGITVGYLDGHTYTSPELFWATRNGPNLSDYHEHALGAASTGTAYRFEFLREGSDSTKWDVYLNGTYEATTTMDGTYHVHELEYGAELTDSSPSSDILEVGSAARMQYFDGTNWNSGWSDGTGSYEITPSPASSNGNFVFAGWTTKYTDAYSETGTCP